MPVNKYAFARYYLIDAILRKMNYVKTSYIVESCNAKLGYSVSQRTIQKDLDAMRNDPFIGFFAPIEYCKKRKAYYYSHANFTLTTLNFSKEEVKILLILIDFLKNKVDDEYIEILDRCIYKIKILSS
ncbi:MAG: hypothetical protein LBJ72_07885 [Dysgonamonadaceae bacterium]|jgi:predicted DNA-binding transcriptional regulator YafY|nr:hypothetical protein [Dysgonamonadaceae bacterium]